MPKDYYGTLDVAPSASDDEIKRAYRKLAREYHPDSNGGTKDAEEKFKDIAEAYSVLSDPQKRSHYDRFGDSGSSFTFDPFDIFRSFFAGDPLDIFGGASRGQTRGRDLALSVEVDLIDVLDGTTRPANYRTAVVCEKCSGTGAAPGTTSIACQTCGGAGSVRSRTRSIFGDVVTATTCPDCRGEGSRLQSPCSDCHGEGRTIASKKLDVDVPAGVEDGMQLRIRAMGEAGLRGAPAGDLYVTVRVAEDRRVERHGRDLLMRAPIAFTQATLGAEISVESFDGVAGLHVQPGTKSGETLRLRGRGLPSVGRSNRGDLHVQLIVETPSDLNEQQEELLREFARSRGEQVGQSGGFLDRLKQRLTS